MDLYNFIQTQADQVRHQLEGLGGSPFFDDEDEIPLRTPPQPLTDPALDNLIGPLLGGNHARAPVQKRSKRGRPPGIPYKQGNVAVGQKKQLAHSKIANVLKRFKQKSKTANEFERIRKVKLEKFICSRSRLPKTKPKLNGGFEQKGELQSLLAPALDACKLKISAQSSPLGRMSAVHHHCHEDFEKPISHNPDQNQNEKTCDASANPESNTSQPPPKKKKRIHKPAMCDECGQIFARQNYVTNHKRIKHGAPSQCPICALKFKHGRVLWSHFLRKHTQEGINLEAAGIKAPPDVSQSPETETKYLPVEISLSEKELSGDTLRGFFCDRCGKSFPKTILLKRHIYQTHYGGDDNKPYMCQECSSRFKMKYALEQHINLIHRGLDFRCELCSKKMQSAGKLWRHKVEFHKMSNLPPPSGTTLTQCEVCGETLLRGYVQCYCVGMRANQSQAK